MQWWGRCDEGGGVDACALPGGHEAWEVRGVCEEDEDGLERVGEMLLGEEVVAHGGWWGCRAAILQTIAPEGDAIVWSSMWAAKT